MKWVVVWAVSVEADDEQDACFAAYRLMHPTDEDPYQDYQRFHPFEKAHVPEGIEALAREHGHIVGRGDLGCDEDEDW